MEVRGRTSTITPRPLFERCVSSSSGSRRLIQRIYGMQDERHSYEKCQYDEFKKRVAKMDQIREAKGGARSN